MSPKTITFVVLIVSLFSACKNDKSQNENQKGIDPNFKITLNVIVKKNDNFSLFYTQDGTADFSKTKPIWVGVKGKESEQKVVYVLPKKALPTQLRLDFGLANNQENIILKSVIIENNGKKREIKGSELAGFFIADVKKCTFNASNGVIKAVINDGVRQYPSLYPQEETLKAELEKLAQ